MSKTATQSVGKWQQRSASASGDYIDGARTTEKDQAQRAIAAAPIYKQGLQESFARGSYEKGLQRSGKAGWFSGVEQKGGQNYSTGVSTVNASQKYSVNSGKYDNARKASDSMPRGPRGSAANLNKVATVANALHIVRVGKV